MVYPPPGLDTGSGSTELESSMSDRARQGEEGSSLHASLSSLFMLLP